MQYKMSYPQERPVATATVKHPMKVHPQIKRRPSSQLPFDPDDLSQRLLKVLADRRAYAERKGRERAGPGDTGRGISSKSRGFENDGALRAARAESYTGRTVKEKAVHPKPVRPATSHGESFRSRSTQEEPQRKGPNLGLSNPNSKAGYGTSDSYHHMPQAADSQFVGTAKAEFVKEKGLIHKLSKRAMKFHLHSPQAERLSVVPDPEIGPDQHPQMPEKLWSNRVRAQERSQQQGETLDVVVEGYEEPKLRAQYRHTFEDQLGLNAANKEQEVARRMSTGDLLANQAGKRRSMAMAMLESHGARPYDKSSIADGVPNTIHERRVDWTQNDETQHKARVKIAPLLRKADSIWTLRGRLGSFGKSSRDERVSSQGDMSVSSTATETPKSPKASFFARFKR